MSQRLLSRNLYFLLFWIASLLFYRHGVGALVSLAWNDDHYTHIVFIPFICLGLIYFESRTVFNDVHFHPRVSLPLAALGGGLYCVAEWWSAPLGQYGSLSLEASAIIVTWIAGFVFFYGTACAKAASFPLSLLLLAIPLPPSLIAVVEVALQKGSAEVTYVIFKLAGTPVFREGLIFSLPGVTIEVAQECSGIRAAIALFITGLLLSHLFLRSTWRRGVLVILTVPIAIFKNALRIAILSWLGAYVSRDYLLGNLHHRGGPLFSLLSLALLLPALWLLRRSETRRPWNNDLRTRGRGLPRPRPKSRTIG